MRIEIENINYISAKVWLVGWLINSFWEHHTSVLVFVKLWCSVGRYTMMWLISYIYSDELLYVYADSAGPMFPIFWCSYNFISIDSLVMYTIQETRPMWVHVCRRIGQLLTLTGRNSRRSTDKENSLVTPSVSSRFCFCSFLFSLVFWANGLKFHKLTS